MTLASRIQQQTGTTQLPTIHTAPNLIVEALAGTGKTTTLVQALKRLLGLPTDVTPSPQQEAVWQCIELSKGLQARDVCFVAFNKTIAVELGTMVPEGCSAMTMHGLGNRAVWKAFGKLEIPEDPEWVVRERIAKLLKQDKNQLFNEEREFVESTRKLVSLCKMNLTGTCSKDGGVVVTDDELDDLCSHYDVDVNGSRSRIFEIVPQILNLCLRPQEDGMMDFDDMIWLPVALDLRVWRNRLLLVDEGQDLNRCQQELAYMAGDRICVCGDRHQAIYGFAGADSESLGRMQKELASTNRGCEVLPLTVTRRCGKAIVREAKRIVPAFEAHENNHEGNVETLPFGAEQAGVPYHGPTYHPRVKVGDMVVCRTTACLVSQCFKFLSMGVKAYIQGRDMVAGLKSTVKKQKCKTAAELQERLDHWLRVEREKELAKKRPSENRLISLQDRYDCVMVFMAGAETVEQVITNIDNTFSAGLQCPKCKKQGEEKQKECKNPKCGKCKLVPVAGVKLSSIHRAKGLEANTVFFLMPKTAPCPHPMAKSAWQQKQEMNLLYVGITRAKQELIYVM